MDLWPICPSLFIFFSLLTFSLLNPLTAEDEARKATPPYSSSPPPLPPPPPPYPPSERSENFSPFRPSIAVIVGVLTTMFSVTFLLLLYAKHCKRGNGVVAYSGNPNSRLPPSSTARKNSGIDRSVIESLPIFRFGSLTGQKDGLECAVCLTRFEPTEVLRLLPKCKHAFHIECVDTWLDAHSTCPLCRYRVDPEDIFLIDNPNTHPQQQQQPPPLTPERISGPRPRPEPDSEINPELRRISGRHSSAGERGTGSGNGFLQIVIQKPGASAECHDPMTTTSFRRSLDSTSLRKKSETVAVGCFDRRKDGLLLTEDRKKSFEQQRRLEHRIIISAGTSGLHQRWSDVQPSDLLYLRTEMIISDSRRYSSASGSWPSVSSKTRQYNQNLQTHQNQQLALHLNSRGEEGSEESIDGYRWSGRNVINTRCVSEITGLSRLGSSSNYNYYNYNNREQEQQQRQAGVVSRWLAWISQSRPAVRSGSTPTVA